MMKSDFLETPPLADDASLVLASRAGQREAFGHIVARYQTLICSLAYSHTGSLSQSEDLAQETFITAWKQLANLREPQKLRSWLCAIARHRIYDSFKQQEREPSHQAESLTAIEETSTAGPSPHDQAITQEESILLWRAIERIPEVYREPLVLFYREHQSVATVAENLELSEDAVKQRLARGRKLLQDEVQAFVEGALAKSNPGPAFTLAVVAALPAFTLSAKAATLGIAAKSGLGAKIGGGLGWAGVFLGPLLAIGGNYAAYRLTLDQAVTESERQYIRKIFRLALLVALGGTALVAVPLLWNYQGSGTPTLYFGILFSLTLPLFFLTIFSVELGAGRWRKAYLTRLLTEQLGGQLPPSTFEYRSPWQACGLPLIHIRFGGPLDRLRGPVKAWIAIGSHHALGVIFAFGNVAIAPVSFGGITIGLLPFGALSFGLVSVGAVCVGVWAFGAMAIGWQICCGFGAAWHSAMGGCVVAHDFALGGIVRAGQANSAAAQAFYEHNRFCQIAEVVGRHSTWLIVLGMAPVLLQWRPLAKARRQRQNSQARILKPESLRPNGPLPSPLMKKTWPIVVASGCLVIAVILSWHSHSAATAVVKLSTDTSVAPVIRSVPPTNFTGEKPVPAPTATTIPNATTLTAQTANTNTSTDPIRLKVTALLAAPNQTQKQALLEELRRTRQLDAALTQLRQLAAEHPNDPSIPTTIGQTLLKQAQTLAEAGDGDHLNEMGILGLQANQSFDAALKIDPQNWEAQFTKAAMMYYWPAELGRDNEVIQRLSNLIDQQETLPGQADFAQTYVVLGNEYQKLGQRDKAQATWTLGLEKFPGNPMLLQKTSGQ